jgi:hypothetical protein
MKSPIRIKPINTIRSRFPIPTKIAPGLGLSLLLGLGFALSAAPASARQFTKLVEIGQKVPGSDRPVTTISSPVIGLDGQVAVQLATEVLQTPTSTTVFRGIYAIPKGRSLQLLEGGSITTEGATLKGVDFLGPSISGGKIAYIRRTKSLGSNPPVPDVSTLRLGSAGNVRSILNLPPEITGIDSNSRQLAYVNGKVYFIGVSRILPSVGGFPIRVLGAIDTQSVNPSFNILNQDVKNQTVAASANTLVLTQAPPRRPNEVTHFESTGDGNFQEITGFAGCRDLSTSHESLAAICTSRITPQNPAVQLRFGRQGVPIQVPTPNVSSAPSLVSPSLSNRSVLYLRLRFSGAPDDRTRLYLSQNGQAPITLLKDGDQLDGKTVSTIGLGESGRTLAGNSAVFTVGFQDNSTALYRVDW